ncbi:hypothetical protein M404DRAFT_767431 [Pisolithus tinctorius Marx 270]|uniref:Uncharacterized protein n=1 Tax=Pisolithus tinctorius Marx 270 TaxID=870435 RepID=A0A0C3ITQ8_PISTI|nr:hypothetical protein M404DRAFT_767431 [Pisolithus tinctorius Marx 270]
MKRALQDNDRRLDLRHQTGCMENARDQSITSACCTYSARNRRGPCSCGILQCTDVAQHQHACMTCAYSLHSLRQEYQIEHGGAGLE